MLRVTLYAVTDPEFRAEWDCCVREAADGVCAQVAGQRMAGAVAGYLEWSFDLPVPPGMDEADAARAFKHTVSAVVSERVSRWTGPGGPG